MVIKSTPRTRHNPTEIRQIRGFPTSLKLFRMSASKYWYVRMYMPGGPSSGVKKSTRSEYLADAEKFAINWYEERLLEKRAFRKGGSEAFATFAAKFQEQQKRLIRRDQLDPLMFAEDRRRLENDLLPKIGSTHISKIDYTMIDEFLDELRNKRGLSQSTLKKYVILVRKVLKEAERDNTISHIPTLPTITGKEQPRPWFSPEEYSLLLAACRDLRDNPPGKYEFDFGELYDFIVFMVHSFLRPSEWKSLQNKHIRFLSDDEGVEQLLISVPNPKTFNTTGVIDSTTIEIAADLYRNKILQRHDSPEDSIFLIKLEIEIMLASELGECFHC